MFVIMKDLKEIVKAALYPHQREKQMHKYN